VRYEYNDLGNLRHRVQESGVGKSFNYSYGKGNGAGPFAVSAMNSLTYSYEAGNQTAAPQFETKFTSYGLPLHIDRGSNSYDFGYDGFGNRVFKRSVSSETISVANLFERESSGPRHQVFTVMGPHGAIAQVNRTIAGSASDTVYYIHADNLGSTESVSDQSGSVTEKRQYDPIGNLIGFNLPGVAPIDGKKHRTAGSCSETNCFDQYLQSAASLSAFTTTLGFTAHREDPEVGLST
jgi:hypothetical protein